MTDRLFILFTSAVLFASVSCRNSAKTAAPAPTASPTADARNVTPFPPVAAAAQTEAAPGPPIQVTPPASFSAAQLKGRTTLFLVPGQAGQFLRVKVNGGEPNQSVSAQLLRATPRPIKALWDQGDCSGNFVYHLPETASYQVEFRPVDQHMGVDLSLLPSDDPMLDPGIKPDEIFIDPGPFAKGKQTKMQAFGQWKGCEGDWEPSHWVLKAKDFEIRIMQVAGYKKVFSSPDMVGDVAVMEDLEAAVKPGAKIPANISLPYPVYGDAGLNFSTHPQLLEGNGWRGLRFIASYGQDIGCWFDNAAYVFEGITNDGRFFILVHARVSNPQVEKRLAQDCTAAEQKIPSNQRDHFYEGEVRHMYDKKMSAADPASFIPNLDQLDAVIKSLKLKR